MLGVATRVRTALAVGLVAVAAAGALAVLDPGSWEDRSTTPRLDPDRVRSVRFSVVLRPARKVSIRWRIGARGSTETVATPTWVQNDKARRGDLLVVEVIQLVTGPYAHCAIQVDGTMERFQKRDGESAGARCNVAFEVV